MTAIEKQINKKIKKLVIWVIRIIILVTIVICIWAQNNYITTCNYNYDSLNITSEYNGLKILHISDICNTKNSVVRTAKKSFPDIILVTGGYEDKNGNYDRTVKIIKNLCKIAPVYYIYNKNDEYGILDNTEAINITNSYIDINRGGTDNYIRIIGAPNMVDYSEKDIADIINNLCDYNNDSLNIVLNGNLLNLDSICNTYADVILVGGTFGKVGDEASCSKGFYSYKATDLFVSGGCGNYDSLRIFNLPEIQCITLNSLDYSSMENIDKTDKYNKFKKYTYTSEDLKNE